MIDYLTHPKLANYNPFQLPSKHGGGGGIHVKTHFVREALESVYPTSRLISNTSEIEASIVLIEPLRFAMGTDQAEELYGVSYEPYDVVIQGLEHSKAKKILLTTEYSMLRLEPALRKRLLGICDVVVASCKFQNNLLKYVGCHASHIVRDPISKIYCSPFDWTQRKDRIVAVGNISWQKNAQQVIDVFNTLQGDIETMYIGSHSLWYDARNDERFSVTAKLQDDLYNAADIVVPECTIQDLAMMLHQSKYGLWVATHDATATGTMSMLRAGMIVVAAPHGYAAEIPVQIATGTESQVKRIKALHFDTEDKVLAHVAKGNADWCEKNISYSAFVKQLTDVLRTIK